ncbi:hypothetical protein DY000_02052251 [Brassica cretica]|uniref:DUF1204 domain-containing protein n=1 Tax=Brassica cretica TaxID=69181 RepID=A0ABQ7AFN1_BRACR|nr:hypothetical protein DY000_02052251 [Brassica cretica]
MKTLKWREFEAKPKPKAKEERQIQRTGLWYGLDRWEETRLRWGMTSSVFGEKEIKKDLRNLDKFVSWGIRVLWQSNNQSVEACQFLHGEAKVMSKSRSVQFSPVKASIGFWPSPLRSTSCLSAKNTVALGKDDRIAWCWTSWSKVCDSDWIVPSPSRSASGPWCWVGRSVMFLFDCWLAGRFGGVTDMAPLVGGSEDEVEHSQEVLVTPSVQTQSSDRLTRQLVRRLLFCTSGFASKGRSSGKSPLISIHYSDGEDILGERQHLVSLSPGSKDETVAATRKRRQSSEGALPGPSRPRFVPEGDGSLCAAQSDLISLAGRMRYAVSVSHLLLPRPRRKPTTRLRWRVRSLNEYVVVMKDQVVASRNDKEIESIGSEIKRLSKELEATKREWKKDTEKIEALTEDWRRIHLENEALTTQMVAQKVRITALEVERDRDIRRASRVARRAIATRYREILESLKDKWARKKKEVCAEIQLQEMVANIDLLNELKDGGLTVDTELARLKEMEGDCEALVASVAVSDWSVSELDLPQVSDDSADQVGGSYVPVDSASS